MNGPKPTAEEHREETGRNLEVQTDKDLWKIVPCTYAGCNVDLVVNVFYAPHKGKCNEHGDRKTSAVVASHLTFATSDAEVKPNGALAKLECPICQNPLVLLKIEEDTGWLTFGCTDGYGLTAKQVREKAEAGGKFCGTSITIRPHWSAMEFKTIPSRLTELVKEFNIDQKMRYFDKVGY